MNKVVLIGNLTKKPELVDINENKLTKISVAVTENYTNLKGEKPVSFFNVIAWGKLGENCVKYLDKGSKVGIEGKLQNRKYEKDGETKYVFEIVAEEIEYLSVKRDNE